jgi:putative transposase
MIRYVRIPRDDGPLRRRLEELAAERRRFGFRRLAVLLRRDGLVVNIKRVLRVYREANLQSANGSNGGSPWDEAIRHRSSLA